MKNKDPAHRAAIKKLQEKARKAGSVQYGDVKKKKTKKDPIAHAHKESSKSPNKMYKESMAHLHSLMNKKK